MFAGDGYDQLVTESTRLLDRLAASSDAAELRTLERIFATSVRYEVQFWDMAYAGPAITQR